MHYSSAISHSETERDMTSQPYMNETPCQHGNYACPLCDAVSHSERNTMGPLDIFTDAELMQHADDAYRNTMRLFEDIEARKLYGPAAIATRSAAYEQAELHKALCMELARRTANADA